MRKFSLTQDGHKYYQNCLGIALVVICIVLFSNVNQAHALSVIDFDDLSGGTQSGDVLAASGVSFVTGNITDTVAVNDVITFANPVAEFDVFVNQNAISGSNFAVAKGGGLKDLLISFATPVTSVSVISDDALGEAPDIIRLLALVPTANLYEFVVIGIDEAFDDGITPSENLLSLDLGGNVFSFAIFQTTTEQEGFDDLTFTTIPEPSTLFLVVLGVVGILSFGKKRLFT